MSDELDALMARTVEIARIEMGDAPGVEKPLPTPEEVRLADAALQDQESDAVAAMLFTWTSAQVMKDIIDDMLTPAKEEDDEEKQRKQKQPQLKS